MASHIKLEVQIKPNFFFWGLMAVGRFMVITNCAPSEGAAAFIARWGMSYKVRQVKTPTATRPAQASK